MPAIGLIGKIDKTFVDPFLDEQKKFYEGIVASVNKDVAVLNTFIQSYNNANDITEKQRLLKSIYRYRQEMAVRYPLDFISRCPLYQHQIQDGLWTELKSELNALAIPSVTTLLESGGIKTPVTEYFSNMPQHKMAAFMSIYWENLNVTDKLDRLFSMNEPGFAEFNQIRENYNFRVIPGGGNSRNILIESKIPSNDAPRLVLKVDVRLGNPKEHEQTLRDASFQHLTQLHGAERQASFIRERDVISANLVITDYCAGGSLKSPVKKSSNKAKTPSELAGLTRSALDYFQQMTTILLEMQLRGVAFPDPKLSNWLDNEMKLMIADTKTFLSCDPVTFMIDQNSVGNRWTVLRFSAHLCPYEFRKGAISPYSADKMHAYMVGKNLYQYLTGCDSSFLSDYTPGVPPKYAFSEADFEYDVFRTDVGIRLRNLINNLVQRDPENRISLKEALDELNRIIALQKKQMSDEQMSDEPNIHDDHALLKAYSECRAEYQKVESFYTDSEKAELNRCIMDAYMSNKLDDLLTINASLKSTSFNSFKKQVSSTIQEQTLKISFDETGSRRSF